MENEQQTQQFTLETKVETKTEIKPLKAETVACYTESDRKAIYDLVEKIDVSNYDKIMSYGSVPLITTFEQCGNLLKKEEGSDADQKVIREVIELSNAANKSYEDFNLALKEPNFWERLFLKISSRKREERAERIKQSAITNYKLLKQLKDSCDSWINMLQDSMGDITGSRAEDIITLSLLEKYLVAGYIKLEKVESLLVDKKNVYEKSGLQKDEQDYQSLNEGYELFKIVLSNLEKSRVMYSLSIGQLSLAQRSNRNLQLTIRTQKNNSMTLISQQIRNALLDAKNKKVLEGKQAINGLSNELMKKVSQNVAITAEESEKLLYSGFYSIGAAKEAITTVVNSYSQIQKVSQEMLPKLRTDLDEVNKLLNELAPHVSKIKGNEIDNLKPISTQVIPPNDSLTF